MNVHGVSLHYYSEAENSDKYYRMWYHQEVGSSRYLMVQHWGRDGLRGQFKPTTFRSEQDADLAVTAKTAEQMKKGYKLLGTGMFGADRQLLSLPELMSVKVRDWIGVPMVKVPAGFDFVIQEEDSIEDLLQCSETSTHPPADSATG